MELSWAQLDCFGLLARFDLSSGPPRLILASESRRCPEPITT